MFCVDGCIMFICYHCCCGIKVILMLSSSIATVLFVVLIVLPVIGLGRRNVLLVAYFILCVWLFWC
jgi:hypothetical protein